MHNNTLCACYDSIKYRSHYSNPNRTKILFQYPAKIESNQIAAEQGSNNFKSDAENTNKVSIDKCDWERSLGYRRSKSSNALETPRKNVTFMKRKKDLSEEAQQKLYTTGDTEDAKTNKNATPNKKVSYEFSTYGEEPKHIDNPFGPPLKKKSFSLMSIVARKNHDVTLNPTERDTKTKTADLGERNGEIKQNHTERTISHTDNEKLKTILTKVVSPSEQCVNPTKRNVNGANDHTSSSTHLIPSLSSKVLRVQLLY